MAKGNFERCHEVTAKWEGGWSNHAQDPGGATMYGVTQAVYDDWRRTNGFVKQSVRRITRAEAILIYRTNYWTPVNGETLAAGVDLAVYDAGVNSGVSRGKKWLLASLGGTPAETVKRICAKRLGFVHGLRTWKTFGKGWSRRIADIEAKGVAWAMAASGGPIGSVKPALKAEVEKARRTAGTQGAGSVASGTVGTGSGVVSGQADQAGNMTLLIALGVIAVAIAVVLIWRARVNDSRAEAYEAEAKKLP